MLYVSFVPHFRILELSVERYRNLHDLRFSISPETSLVCLVGENGTGKTTILEVLGLIATRLGLARGVENLRNDPNHQAGIFSARVQVTQRPEDFFPPDLLHQLGEPHAKLVADWDGVVTVDSDGTVYAGDKDTRGRLIGERVSAVIRAAAEVFYLFLDADRSYPPTAIQAHEYGNLMQRHWETIDDRLNSAFRLSRTLYGEWISYMVAREGQSATRLQQAHRRALAAGEELPEFEDPFASYTDSLRQVLPHLRFSTVDMNRLMPLFDTTGAELTFSGMSSGEREIAFLVGQIERFGLRHGLLLVDEPELHLSPDLVRTWIAFLRDSIVDGQVWIATHSLEAVETAGPEASFLFERDPDSREVCSAVQLVERPLAVALSAALGTPAFALSRHRFVFVEGERANAERERFHRLCGSEGVRFIEAGGCRSVIAKRATIADLAVETGNPIRVGAIVDRDFRTDDEVASLRAVEGVHVLDCHEIENLLLDPPTLAALLARNGKDREATEVIQDASDRFAGLWIFRRAVHREWGEQRVVPGITLDKRLRQAVAVTWSAIEADVDGFVHHPTGLNLDDGGSGELAQLEAALAAAREAYAVLRADQDRLWRETLGKEVVRSMPSAVGFSDANGFERNALSLWTSEDVEPPAELVALRAYVEGIVPAA